MRGRTPKRKEVIWNDVFAYGVGLMASDGNLSKDGRHLTFVSKDREQIQAIKKCFGISAKTRTLILKVNNEERLYYRLQWGDVTLYRFFISIGLTPNKSLRLQRLNVPDAYYIPFLLGNFDGDGSFYSYFDKRWKNSYMFYLSFVSGSKHYIYWLQQTNKRLLGVEGHVTKNKTETLFQLKYAKSESLILVRQMYPKGTKMFLKRKKLKIVRALRIVNATSSESLEE